MNEVRDFFSLTFLFSGATFAEASAVSTHCFLGCRLVTHSTVRKEAIKHDESAGRGSCLLLHSLFSVSHTKQTD